MQQTQNYKLNLIETSDPFSPNPLNENAEKTEAELATMDSRVVKLENCRIILGCYDGTGDSTPQIIHLGERPVAVMVNFYVNNSGNSGFAFGNGMCSGPYAHLMKLTDDGFWVNEALNRTRTFYFVAFMGDWPTQGEPCPEAIANF